MPGLSLSKLWWAGPAVVRAQWCLRSAERIGRGVRVWGGLVVRNRGHLLIGDRVRILSHMAITELAIGEGATLEFGDGVYVNYGCSIAAMLEVRIGAGSSIGSHVIMMDNDYHSLEPERRNELPPSAPIILEENVWVGVRAIVLRGVRIGAGSVIAAGSVVTKDIPPRSLAAGVPAKVIRTL